MTKPFEACSLADLAHELQLAARDTSGGALSADVVARITPCLLDRAHTKAVLQRHPRFGGSSGLVCSAPGSLPMAAPECAQFDLGCRVRVMGLVQAAQHNGKMGVVIAPLDLQTGRIGVKLEEGCEIRIKPCNMQLQQHPDDDDLDAATTDSKQAWCSMLRDLFLSAGVSVSDAAHRAVYLVVKQCAMLGRVRLPQAGSPVAVVQFKIRSSGSFEKQCNLCACAQGQGQGQGFFHAKTGDGSCCSVVNSVCTRMRGSSLESLRLLDYQQNRHWPAARVIEIASGRWCLQIFTAAEQLHGARVFMRMCNAQGVALVRIQLAPAAQRLRLRTLVPIYEMTMEHRQRMRGMGCGVRGKLALLMSQGWGGGGAVPRDCSPLMDRILRRVAAAQVAATPEGLHAQAQALIAAGECAAAAALLQQADRHGHLPSRADLASMLMDGREGVAADCKRAVALAEEGTRLGCHHCQGVTAMWYLGGVGVKGCDRDEAQKLLSRSFALARASAGEGSKYGQRALGQLYKNAQDYDAAVAQFRLAAAQHYDLAQNYLGHMICNGLGVAQDHVEALRWFKLAAAQGLGAALNNVGKYHEYGLTVAADVAEAIRWYKRAAAAGLREAADALKRLGA